MSRWRSISSAVAPIARAMAMMPPVEVPAVRSKCSDGFVGRVASGDCSPEAPTDPGLRGAPAPGSSPHVATSAIRCVAWTWWRSQCTWHVSRHRFMRWRPLPSPGSLRLVPLGQQYYETLRLPAVRLAALRFLRLAIPSFRPRFVPTAWDLTVDHPGVGLPGSRRLLTMETTGSPKFPGDPS